MNIHDLRVHEDLISLIFNAGSDQEFFLNKVCSLIHKQGYKLVWIGVKTKTKEKKVKPVAFIGFEEGYINKLNIIWKKTARGIGPTGTAIRTNKPVIARHIFSDPNFKPWRADAKKRGYGSSAAIPISFMNEVFGSLNLYKTRPDAFGEEEVTMLLELCFDIGMGLKYIENLSKKEKDLSKFKAIFDNATDGIFLINKAGTIINCNSVVSTLTGYPKKYFINKNLIGLHKLIEKKDILKVISSFGKIKSGKDTPTYEVGVRTIRGKILQAEINSFPLLEDNKIKGIVAIIRNITERKQIERKTQDLIVLQSRFISSLTHVIRTPLTNISWSAETLMEPGMGKISDEQRVLLLRIISGKEQIEKVMSNISIVMDIQKGTVTIAPYKILIPSMVDQVLEDLETAIKLKTQTVDFKQSSGANYELVSDPEKTKIVLRCLLENAVRFTADGGKILVSCKKLKNKIEVSIKDNGIGIPKGEQSLVYELFHRASNASKMYTDGIGLGLYIAKHVSELLGGEIGFTSTQGKGSTFWLKLPINNK